MHILITGGAGFIGANLARRITGQAGATVNVIDDLSTGNLENLAGLDVTFTQASILDLGALTEAARGADSIVHLGAIPSVPRSIANPRASHEANTTGTLNVLEVARVLNIAHVIVASSSSVYGANPALPKNERDWTRPMSPYAVSKQATEGYAIAYQYSYGLKTLAFRFFNVYGPLQAANHAYAAVIPKFLDAALAGRPLEVHGNGTQSRDFTHVDTVCEVIIQAVQGQVSSPDPVNLAFGTNTSLLELIALLESQLGHRLEKQFRAARPGDVHASQADGLRVRDLFPTVAPISLTEGLASTLAWFRSRNAP